MRSYRARGAALILLGVILGFLGIVDLVTDDSRRALVDMALAAVAVGVGSYFVHRDRAE